MASVRKATEADVPALMAMFEALHDESPYYRALTFAPDKVEATLRFALASPVWAVFVLDKDGEAIGCAAVVATPHPWHRETVATEITLYVKPEHRHGRGFVHLLCAMRMWAAGAGAVRLVLGVSTGIATDRVARVYRRLGFEHTGEAFAIGIRQ